MDLGVTSVTASDMKAEFTAPPNRMMLRSIIIMLNHVGSFSATSNAACGLSLMMPVVLPLATHILNV